MNKEVKYCFCLSPDDWFAMNLKCLFGLHNWKKLGGPRNVGGGKFEQRYKCSRCYKIKTVRD